MTDEERKDALDRLDRAYLAVKTALDDAKLAAEIVVRDSGSAKERRIANQNINRIDARLPMLQVEYDAMRLELQKPATKPPSKEVLDKADACTKDLGNVIVLLRKASALVDIFARIFDAAAAIGQDPPPSTQKPAPAPSPAAPSLPPKS